MKKTRFFIVTLLVVVTVSVAVVSCKKGNETTKANASENKTSIEKNMDEYLISFKKRLLSAQKGEETISKEQAQRDLGNLLNFDFGDANYATDSWHYDTLNVSLELFGDDVDLSQLSKTYTLARAKIIDAFEKVLLPEKSVYSIDCSILNTTKNGEDNVQLILTSRGLTHLVIKPTIDTTDNWRVTDNMGKCDGTCVGDDHATIIQKVYKNNMDSWACDNGRIYFTNPGYEEFNSSSFIEENPNIHYSEGHRLWYDSFDETFSHCVEYPEMQYYYNNFVSIINGEIEQIRQQNYDDTYVIKDVRCRVDCFVSIIHPYMFVCEYDYAKYNCTTQGPDY